MRPSQRPTRTIFCQSSRLAAMTATCCQNCSCVLQFTGLPRSNRSAFKVSENRRLGRPRPLAPPLGMKTSTSYSTVSELRSKCPVHRRRLRCRCTEGRETPSLCSASTYERWQSCRRWRTRLANRKKKPSRQQRSRIPRAQCSKP